MSAQSPQYELPRVTRASFSYGGVYVLPLAALAEKTTPTPQPAPAVIAAERINTSLRPEQDFDATVIGLFPRSETDQSAAQGRPAAAARSGASLVGPTSYRIASVAAAAGLVFAGLNPGNPAPHRPFEGSSQAQQKNIEGRAAAPVGERITVPKEAGAPMERISYTSSENPDAQLTRVMTASSKKPEDTAGVLAHPVKEIRITSRFGSRPDPWGGNAIVNHIGQDYGYACGTEVYAAAGGVVIQAEWAGHSGNRVSVDHGNGLVTTYNHNSVLKVAVGDQVHRGQLLALGGTTGNSTGCHLHFEVLVDGVAVDPRGWLPPEN